MTSLYLGTFLVALETIILNPILLTITRTFDAIGHLAWYGSAYLLALTALQPILGKLYKLGDVKMLYLVSVGVFEVGSVLCAIAPSSVVFILGRAVAGYGAAGLMQGSFAVVTKTVPLSRRPFFFGLFVSAFGVSIGIGPVLGGLLADRGLWRWCFWINLPLGAVVMGLVVVFLRLEKEDRAGRVKSFNSRHYCGRFLLELDLGGSILLVASMCCLFMAMQWGGHRLPWSSAIIVGLFATSSVVLVLFLIYGVYIAMFFQTVKEFSAQRSGVEMLFLTLTQILTVVVAGTLVSRSGLYTPFIILGTGLSVVGSGLITLLNVSTSHGVWSAYFIICAVLKEEDMVTGNGKACLRPTIWHLTDSSALLQFAFQLGGAVSLCISQTIFLSRLAVDIKSSMADSPVVALNNNGANKSAYHNAVRDVFVFLLVTSGLALVASFGFEHKNVKKVEEAQKTGSTPRAGVE
ncbi:major facilitator superfamily domain-containing protein [Alternaria rosae]|uniref:major facilitator superfamily domain-containing protein n=1 Tax=Alternaria rosae TaxID=1187941 RepID=UPI001E8CE0CA|nr:major facilitator superfamily domain-containing protein [Alternaria rosae]KAH6873053.1 major facilitator superfamily domain-containing protein [Alternaria rosae]